MKPELQILFWWVMFGATHVLGSTVPVRTALISKLGLQGFKGVYSLVSFATFVPLVYVYFTNVGAGAMLFRPSAGLMRITEALMLLAFIVGAQALATMSPLTTAAELAGDFAPQPRGIQRVTRHPSNLAFSLFAVAHMISNPYAADWMFFGGFVVFGVISTMHQDRRTRASGRPEIARFQEETSLLPFAAILSGKQRLAFEEYNKGALAVGIVLAAVLWYFHPAIIGGYGAV